jgi:predicted amidophosphoribosyltransferase
MNAGKRGRYLRELASQVELMSEEEAEQLRCASCGDPAQQGDGLCAECAEKLDKLACSFEGREG